MRCEVYNIQRTRLLLGGVADALHTRYLILCTQSLHTLCNKDALHARSATRYLVHVTGLAPLTVSGYKSMQHFEIRILAAALDHSKVPGSKYKV